MSGEKNISQTMSKKIAHMMFFLSVLVVYIHIYDASLVGENFRAERALEDLFSQGVCRIAVPLFFMISGYLHFSREGISVELLLRQLPRKVPTLVIPYLLWNIIHTICFLSIKAMAGDFPQIDNWAVYIVRAVFLYETNGVFWYVFQLILLFGLSPFLYSFYRNVRVGVVSCCVFFVMYLFIRENTKVFLLPGLFFFSMGAIAALHGRHVVDWAYQNKSLKRYGPIIACIAFALLMLWRVNLMDLDENISLMRDTVGYRLFECLAAISFWFCTDIIAINRIEVRHWEKDSFFVYSTHTIVLMVFNAVINKLIPSTPLLRAFVYLFGPIVIVALILLGLAVLKRVAPKAYQVLSGGR